MKFFDNDFKIFTNYIVSFESLPYFSSNLIEKWVIDLIGKGYKNDAIFMLASFSKPIDKFEIKPYLKRVFLELNLKERDGIEASKSFISYHLNEIVYSRNIRINLKKIIDEYYNFENDIDVNDFYLLYYAWDELEELGQNFYFENVDLNTIESVLVEKAINWLKNNQN